LFGLPRILIALEANPTGNYNFTSIIFVVMAFSPVGEELLYQGLIHQSFVPGSGDNKASIIDGLAFSLVHLAHFGIVYSNVVFEILIVPALLWIILMFLTSRLFFMARLKPDQLLEQSQVVPDLIWP
jgi:membrane protease YdiL (CAAX protease family)